MTELLAYRHWAISQDFFNTVGMVAWNRLIKGKSIDKLIKKYSDEELIQLYTQKLSSDGIVVNVSRDPESRLFVASTRYSQNVAIIPVLGALEKRGAFCSYGMRDYISMIDRANKSEKIAGIVLDIESPGGTVDGTNEFGLAVKSSKKPVVAFGDGMVASAAYWVASQAKHIMANKNNPTEFGSIGVLCVHENWQAYIQKEIGSVEILRAKQSTDKATVNYIEPITDEQRISIISELSEIAKDFISTVKKGRGGKLNTGEENIFTGKMYPSDNAHSMGMIDSKGNFQDAINKAGELAINPQTSTSKKVNTQMNFKKLSAIFGAASENAEGLTAEEQASMEAAERKVAEMETKIASLTEQLNTATASITELTTQLANSQSENAALKTTNIQLTEKLEAAPAGAKTTVIEKEVKADDEKYMTSVDEEKKKMKSNF